MITELAYTPLKEIQENLLLKSRNIWLICNKNCLLIKLFW